MTDSLLALELATGDVVWHRQFTAGDVFTFWNMDGPDADIGAAPNLFRIGERDVVGVGDKAGHYVVFDRDDRRHGVDGRAARGQPPRAAS